jgi:hypothetical protein
MRDIADDCGLDWEYTERVLSSRVDAAGVVRIRAGGGRLRRYLPAIQKYSLSLFRGVEKKGADTATITLRPLAPVVMCDKTTVPIDPTASVVCERLDAAQTIAASINFALGGKASLQVSGISPNPPAPVSFRVCRLSWGGMEYPDGSEINVQKIEIFWPTEPTPKEAVDSCMANARKQFASDVKPGCFDGRGWEYGSHRFATDP